MNDQLQPGLEHEFEFVVPESKTVPALYPEAQEFQQMPQAFATGYMVGFIEWVCIQAVNPYIDWPSQQTVGTHVDLSHSAATPPGMKVTAKVRLVEVDARRLVFEVEARDELEEICRGRHERFVIDAKKFTNKLSQKAASKTG